ncbi:MAG: NAD(P)H-hydrate epimerase [Bacillota bacterium]
MDTVSCREMKEMDQYAINVIGIPGMVLMENAALKVVKNIDTVEKDSFLVVCGVGNNGGDGLAIARHLYLMGKRVQVYIIGDAGKGTEDFSINLKILENLELDVINLKKGEDLKKFKSDVENADIIVDAIFGIGVSRDVTGIYANVIEIINESGKEVLAVDIPSGLNGDTGEPMGVAVRADTTVTFHRIKKGLVSGREYAGEVIVENIGIPG